MSGGKEHANDCIFDRDPIGYMGNVPFYIFVYNEEERIQSTLVWVVIILKNKIMKGIKKTKYLHKILRCFSKSDINYINLTSTSET